MNYPRKNSLISFSYWWYFKLLFKRQFRSLNFDSVPINADEALLIFANRFSWWDGFLLFQLNKQVFKKKFHVLVTASDYQKISYLKYFGAFSPETGGKDLIQTLQYAGELLDEPQNLVLIFPQGNIKSIHTTQINFEKGVLQVINASKKKMQVIFSVVLADYFQDRKSSLYAYFKPWPIEEYVSLQLLKNEFNKHFQESKLKQVQKAPK